MTTGLELAKPHFDELDRLHRQRNQLDTEMGLFVPSVVRMVYSGIDQLVNEGIINPNGQFLDLGSGDGRVVACAAIHGMPSIGIEYDPWLVDISLKVIDDLVREGILDRRLARVIKGDYFEDAAYSRAGTDFGKFSTIFNYVDNDPEKIAQKVSRQSDAGTRLLLYGFIDGPETYADLKLEKTLELRTPGLKFGQVLAVYKK